MVLERWELLVQQFFLREERVEPEVQRRENAHRERPGLEWGGCEDKREELDHMDSCNEWFDKIALASRSTCV